jgi:alpha-tubulin suppressor-like RCC1 family protein
VLNLSNAVAIAGGFGHTCALHATGRASCWGNNSNGQLGNNTTNPSPIPTEVRVAVGNLFVLVSPLTGAVNITTGRRHSCALISNGGVRCWGDNTFGQIGVNSTTTLFTTAVGVPSFTLNIDPTVSLKHNNRVATVTVIATCEAGQRLFFDVNLTQGAASGRGSGTGKCTGGLARFEVTVPAQGGEPFFEGAAQVTAEANIRDGGVVVDVQEWTRQVNIVNAP